ncbi:hypothetical protein QJS04_geneDACA004123 [Acorus gramineus]|uniref:Phenylalanyl-tRNA synthetase domain-containing protein n=1 Tax=Acorus gramineus TaxID=55184 RepID=A0AAV9BG11_ACOGR|nr:hypothetical protein QJS04_geneDACA004123 [Acorus gramineus]
MEGVRVFSPDEWLASGVDATSYAAMDLKKTLEGLAQHLFGAVDMRWVDTYFPFTSPSFELEIYFQVCNLTCFNLHNNLLVLCSADGVKTN